MTATLLLLQQVTGAHIVFLSYWGILLALVLLLFFRKRRKPALPIASYIWALLLPCAICDVFWYCYYFQNGIYINHGLFGAVLPLFLFPLLLIISGVLLHERMKKKNLR